MLSVKKTTINTGNANYDFFAAQFVYGDPGLAKLAYGRASPATEGRTAGLYNLRGKDGRAYVMVIADNLSTVHPVEVLREE